MDLLKENHIDFPDGLEIDVASDEGEADAEPVGFGAADDSLVGEVPPRVAEGVIVAGDGPSVIPDVVGRDAPLAVIGDGGTSDVVTEVHPETPLVD